MTRDEFKQWYPTFIKRNAGFYPNRIDYWLDRVDISHERIRSIIGGDFISRDYELKDQQVPLNLTECKDLIYELNSVLPGYFTYYGLDYSVLQFPTIGETKTSKHITSYFNHIYKRKDAEVERQKTRLDIVLGLLGEKWAKSKVKSTLVKLNLSTTPKGFVLLGHYGPDKDSCFRQNSNREHHKYWLSQSEDTFVITLDKKKDEKFKTAARVIGWLDKHNRGLAFLNAYLNKDITQSEVIKSLELVSSEILKSPVVFRERIALIDDGSRDRGFFNNVFGNWSFVKSSERCDRITLLTTRHLLTEFYCPRCGFKDLSDATWDFVDKELFCQKCVKESNQCQISYERTFGELCELNIDGISFFVHPKLVENKPKCKECDCFTDNFHEGICLGCIEHYKTICFECNEYKNNDEIEVVDDLQICKQCLSKLLINNEKTTI